MKRQNMNKIKGSVHIFSLLMLMIFSLSIGAQISIAQSTVQVTVTGIPPILPSPFISDFERNVFNGNYMVSANVTGSNSVNVRFRVRLLLAGDVLVDETSDPRQLNPGFNNLTPFPQEVFFQATVADILNNLPSNRIRQAYQTGSFNEGNYTLTIEPLLASNNAPLGAPGFSAFTVIYPQPPILIAPFNNTVLAESMAVPVFSWSPVMGPPGSSFEYEFLMVELHDGQNPGDAMLSNREHARVTRSNNLFPYTADNLPLELGRSYVWQITARDVNGEIPLKNDGRSEIHVFTFGTVPDEEPFTGVQPPGDPDFDPDPITENIPVTRISGNVSWKYSATEGHLSSMPVIPTTAAGLGAISNPSLIASINDPNYQPDIASLEGQTLHTGNTNFRQSGSLTTTGGALTENAVVPVSGGGRTNSIRVGNISQEPAEVTTQVNNMLTNMPSLPYEKARVRAVYVKPDGTRHVLATTYSNHEGNFVLTFAPSELAQFQQRATGQPASSGLPAGRFQRPSPGDIAASVQARDFQSVQVAHTEIEIEVTSPYADFPDDKTIAVSTSSARNYDVGAIAGTALTFRLDATVLDSETNVEISDATVEVFRENRFYRQHPALRSEGFPDVSDSEEEESFNGSTLVKVAEAGSGRQVTKLFTRQSGFNDRYFLRISAPGYSSRIMPFSARPSILPGEIVIIEQTFEINRANPIVEGRVLRRDTQSPAANVPVALISPDSDNDVYATVTDNDGRFSISDIEPKDEDYLLRISGSRFATYTEEISLSQPGVKVTRDPILLDASLVTVVGRIVSDNDTPVANATVRWAEGGTPVQSDSHGRFVTANTAGTHQLQIRKIGHTDVDTTITITLDESDLSDTVDWSASSGIVAAGAVGQWANSINSTQSFTINQQAAGTFNPVSLGFTGDTQSNHGLTNTAAQTVISNQNLNVSQGQFDSMAAYFNNLLGEDASVSEVIEDLGDIFMSKAVGRLEVTVLAADSQMPLSDITVEVGEDGLAGVTNEEGIIYFDESPGGTVPVRAKAAEGVLIVPAATEVTVTDNGEITYATILLEAGAAAQGIVTAAGEPVEGARIRVEGREDITTTTASDGSYLIAGIPDGEWTLVASKTGFIGDSQTRNYDVGETGEVNFDFTESPFDITTLLGFEIEVDYLEIGQDTTISGAFVGIQSNELFSLPEGMRIPFYDVNVYVENGELKPVEETVETIVTEIRGRLFGYLNVKLINNNGLEVRGRSQPHQMGIIAGEVQIDYTGAFRSALGWEVEAGVVHYLRLPDAEILLDEDEQILPDDEGDENHVVLITSDGSFPHPDEVADFELNLFSASTGFSIYGFPMRISLSESMVRMNGIHFRGSVSIANIPMLDTVGLQLQELWIGTDGTVRSASIRLGQNPTVQLSNWSFEIEAGYLSETGFNLGGKVSLYMPNTAQAQATFSDLNISSERLFGGVFQFPGGGIDLYDIVNIRTMSNKPITFGKVEDEDVYFLKGGVLLRLPDLIDEEIVIPDFIVRTDGDFSITVAPDLYVNFASIADFRLNAVRFSNIGEPHVKVNGQFRLYGIPFIRAQAGGLTYRQGGGVTVDQINLGFSIGAVGEAAVGIEFINTAEEQGFRGSGMMNLANSPFSAAINFYYLNENDMITLGANIQTGLPPVFLGSVAITSIGGGFQISDATGGLSVTLSGAVTVAPGTESVLALEPFWVTVSPGPVITGYTALTVLDQQIAEADLIIDLPGSLFDIEARLEMDQLQDVNIQATGRSRIVLSGGDDPYWMVAARFRAQMIDIFNANANILAAWQVPAGAGTDYVYYTNFVDNQFIRNGTITGFHLDVESVFGIQRHEQVCASFLLGAITGCGYLYNRTQCQVNFDPIGNTFGFFIGSDWAGGGSVSVAGLGDIGGAHATAQGSFSGNYANNRWVLSGVATGQVSGYIGNCNVGCSTQLCFFGPVPNGGSLCAGARVTVDYASNRGLNASLELLDDDD